MNNEDNKITEAEMVVIGGATLLVDGFCFLIDSTLAGAAITPPVQSAVTFASAWWLSSKGDANAFKLGKQLAQHAANILPWLPTLTLAFVINVYIHNHPQVAELAGKAAGGALKKAA